MYWAITFFWQMVLFITIVMILGKGPWLEVTGLWRHKNVAMPLYRRTSESVCYPRNATPDKGAWVDVRGLWRHKNVIMPHCRRNSVFLVRWLQMFTRCGKIIACNAFVLRSVTQIRTNGFQSFRCCMIWLWTYQNGIFLVELTWITVHLFVVCLRKI